MSTPSTVLNETTVSSVNLNRIAPAFLRVRKTSVIRTIYKMLLLGFPVWNRQNTVGANLEKMHHQPNLKVLINLFKQGEHSNYVIFSLWGGQATFFLYTFAAVKAK